jgi:NADH-quinone oxidoreductase subunit L
MTRLLWLIPALPFLGTLLNGVLLRGRLGKRAVAAVACGAVGLSCLLALAAIGSYLAGPEHAAGEPFEQVLYTWIPASVLPAGEATAGEPGRLTIEMGFLLDPLSAVMLFVVTFVGFWIHVYSVGYMAHEPGFQRYFTYLNLFMGAMLLLVLGNNYLVMFVGWEGVGLCSYLLIGFYSDQEFPPFAGRSTTAGSSRRSSRTRRPSSPRTSSDSPSPPSSPCACSWAPRARARRSRSTSGCPMPWPAPRRSRP